MISPILSALVAELRQIGALETPHKAAAYMKAADSLLDNASLFDEYVAMPASTKPWKKLNGVGDSICTKIEEFLMLGYIPKLRALQEKGDNEEDV
jgi:DNA polymerase/3'-5' exonuclease PolX